MTPCIPTRIRTQGFLLCVVSLPVCAVQAVLSGQPTKVLAAVRAATRDAFGQRPVLVGGTGVQSVGSVVSVLSFAGELDEGMLEEY